MTTHTDTIDCNYLTVNRGANKCHFRKCVNPKATNNLITATDDTVMHSVCWNAYDREWKRLHPMTNADIVDSGTQAAEARRGA